MFDEILKKACIFISIVLELLQFEEKESRELVRIIALFYCFAEQG